MHNPAIETSHYARTVQPEQLPIEISVFVRSAPKRVIPYGQSESHDVV